jgi:hypothetical protein
MSEKAPAAGARRRGTSKSRAVAGAAHIRAATSASVSSVAEPPAHGEERLWGRARRSAAQRARRCNEPCWHVVDDLQDPLPVTAAELDTIETYLGQLLDDLLGSRSAA